MKASRMVILLAALAMVLGLATVAASKPKPEEQVMATLKAYKAGWKANDVDKMMEAFSEDYIGGGTGKSDLRIYFTEMHKQEFIGTTIVLEQCKISVDGNSANAGPIYYDLRTGRESWLYRLGKEVDGVWRIVRETQIAGNADLAEALWQLRTAWNSQLAKKIKVERLTAMDKKRREVWSALEAQVDHGMAGEAEESKYIHPDAMYWAASIQTPMRLDVSTARIANYQLLPVSVQVHGNTAIVDAYMGILDGATPVVWRLHNTWINEKGQWQLLSIYNSPDQ